MNKFSIGEVSRIHNISVQTLRYYDKIGLFKPKIINKKSNYRYYSMEQFLQLDIIKYCKSIGLSLDQIKNLIGTNISIEGMFKVINIQQEVMKNKLREMNEIKNHLDSIKDKLSSIIEHESNKVFIKYNEKRRYISFDYVSNNSDELEINYRKAMLEIEKSKESLNYDLAVTTSYDYKKNEITYKSIMFNMNESGLKLNSNIAILPEGEYVTIYFEGEWFKSKKYYDEIIKYINENNIKVKGDFHELYIFPQVDENGQEKTLTQLEILKV